MNTSQMIDIAKHGLKICISNYHNETYSDFYRAQEKKKAKLYISLIYSLYKGDMRQAKDDMLDLCDMGGLY